VASCTLESVRVSVAEHIKRVGADTLALWSLLCQHIQAIRCYKAYMIQHYSNEDQHWLPISLTCLLFFQPILRVQKPHPLKMSPPLYPLSPFRPFWHQCSPTLLLHSRTSSSISTTYQPRLDKLRCFSLTLTFDIWEIFLEVRLLEEGSRGLMG
jgi:hypothetical protein